MSQSLQAKIGDILQALEADGIYEAGPAGLPYSLLSIRTTPPLLFIQSFQTTPPLAPKDTPKITFVHVLSDMAMLTLLQKLDEVWWLLYLRGELRLRLDWSRTECVPTTLYHKAGEELECDCNLFAIDEYPVTMQCWGLSWDLEFDVRDE